MHLPIVPQTSIPYKIYGYIKLLKIVLTVDLHISLFALDNIPSPLVILFLVDLVCSILDNVESVVTPKNFINFTILITLLFR